MSAESIPGVVDRTIHKPQGRSRVSNGKQDFLVPTGASAAARRWRDLAAQFSADISAGAPLSEAQRQLVRRAATICIQCELMEAEAANGNAIDLDLYGQLTDRLGRVVARLGIKRVPRDVTNLSLAQYLAREAEE